MELEVSGIALLLYIEIPTPLIWRAQSCHRAYARECEVVKLYRIPIICLLFTIQHPELW